MQAIDDNRKKIGELQDNAHDQEDKLNVIDAKN